MSWLVSLLALCSIPTFGQYDFVDPDYQPPCGEPVHPKIGPFISSYICWEDWELNVDLERKEYMINNTECPKHITIDHLMIDEEYGDTLNSLTMTPNALKVIDYDQNGRNDFIYPVWVPWAKTYYTTFFKNVDERWIFDFQIEGAIVQLQEGLFIAYHELCCSDYTHYLKEYELFNSASTPSYQLKNYFGFVDDFRRLENQIKQEISFSDPKKVKLIKSDTLFGYTGRIHYHKLIVSKRKQFNPIAIYPPETKAVVLTRIEGPNEQTWLYVSLEPGSKLVQSSYLRDHRIGSLTESKDLLQFMGWVKEHQVTYFAE